MQQPDEVEAPAPPPTEAQGLQVVPAQGVEGTAITQRALQRPPNLGATPIPGGKNVTLRKLVYRVYWMCPHLAPADVFAVSRYGALSLRFMRSESRLRALGELTQAGDPRKLLPEQRGLAAELRQHESALGITASARASLGVDVGRMRAMDLASLMAADQQAGKQ